MKRWRHGWCFVSKEKKKKKKATEVTFGLTFERRSCATLHLFLGSTSAFFFSFPFERYFKNAAANRVIDSGSHYLHAASHLVFERLRLARKSSARPSHVKFIKPKNKQTKTKKHRPRWALQEAPTSGLWPYDHKVQTLAWIAPPCPFRARRCRHANHCREKKNIDDAFRQLTPWKRPRTPKPK